jgi:haloacetate dehalogenase
VGSSARHKNRTGYASPRVPILQIMFMVEGRSTWYAEVGGPLALWRAWATDVYGGPLDAGHFFPEEIPEQTAAKLSDFFG